MANPNPKHKFKSGHKKYGGRTSLPAEIRQIKKITAKNYIEHINEISSLTVSQLKEVANNKTENTLRVCVAKAFLYSIERGEPQRLEYLLQRVLGKVPDKMQADVSTQHKQSEDLRYLTTDELRRILKITNKAKERGIIYR
jgi:hypothetical protein